MKAKKIYLALASFFLVASILSDVDAWDSRIVDEITNIKINWVVLTSSTWGAFNPAGPRTISTNWSDAAYWGWFPVAYFNVTDANNEEFTWSGREVFSPLKVTPSGIAFFIIKSIVWNEYRTVNAGKTYIPGEGTQVDTCFDSPDFSPIGTIPAGFRLLENWDNSPTVQVANIAGTICTTDYLVDPSTVVYEQLGEESPVVELYATGSTGDVRYWWRYGAGANIDTVFARNIDLSTSTFGSGAVGGTSTGYLYAQIENTAPQLVYSSIRNWAPLSFNYVRISGTNDSDNIFSAFLLSNGVNTENIRMYSSWWVAGRGIDLLPGSNANSSIVWGLFMGSRFSGIEVGIGERTRLTYCTPRETQGKSICAYTYEGEDLICSTVTKTGYDTISCGITWSGSVFGSGSCAPALDENGNILISDTGTPGQIIINENWEKIEITQQAPINSAEEIFSGIFSCGIGDSDRWWTVIGKALICPVTVAGNVWFTSWNSLKKLYDWVGEVSWVIQTVGNDVTYSWSTSTWSTNILINKLIQIQPEINNTKIFQVWWWSFIVFSALISILLIIVVLFKK